MNDHNNTSDEQDPFRDNRNSYFDNLGLDKSKIVVEIPAEQPVFPERLPSGFDPMGEIYFRGRAYRGLSGGRIPWWVLISAWITFGGMFVLILGMTFTSPGFGMLLPLFLTSLSLIVTLRGRLAKLSQKKQKRKNGRHYTGI